MLDFNGLDLSLMSVYCADDASVNYGKHHSVYQLLKKENSGLIADNSPVHNP